MEALKSLPRVDIAIEILLMNIDISASMGLSGVHIFQIMCAKEF